MVGNPSTGKDRGFSWVDTGSNVDDGLDWKVVVGKALGMR
jgi:hypothetical protein